MKSVYSFWSTAVFINSDESKWTNYTGLHFAVFYNNLLHQHKANTLAAAAAAIRDKFLQILKISKNSLILSILKILLSVRWDRSFYKRSLR